MTPGRALLAGVGASVLIWAVALLAYRALDSAEDVSPEVAPSDASPVEPAAPARPRAQAPKRAQVPTVGLAGVVRRARDGAPVAGARVTSWPRPRVVERIADHRIERAELAAAPVATAVAGEDGRFSIGAPSMGGWRIQVSRDGFAPAAVDGDGPEAVVELVAAERTALRFVDGADASPLPGAVAHIFPNVREGPPATTLTADADGRAAAWFAGSESVLVFAEGFAPRWWEPDGRGGAEEVALVRGAVVAGTVTDGAGRSLDGVAVVCDCAVAGPTADPVVATSDAAGRFRFDVPDDGTRRRLRAGGGAWGEVALDVFPGEAHILLVLEDAAWIRGVVVDAKGAAVPKFRIEGARVLDGGRFEMGPLAPGVHEVVVRAAEKKRFAAATEVVALRAGESREVRVVVRETPRSHVSARVVTPEGGPPFASDIRVEDMDGRLLEVARGSVIGWVPVQVPRAPGTTVRLSADVEDASGGWTPSAWVEVVTAESAASAPRAELLLRKGRSARLRVVGRDGEPVAGASARVDGPDALLSKGGATLVVAPRARFRVVAWAEGYATHVEEHGADEVKDGVLSVALDEGVEVAGRLDLAEGEDPARLTVRVRAEPAECETDDGTEDVPDGSTDATPSPTGNFRIRGARPGPATLVVLRDEATVRRVPFQVSEGGVDLGTLPFPRIVTLRGRVLDAAGLPVARAAVRIVSEHVLDSRESEEDGTFAADLPYGEQCVVTAVREGLCAAPVQSVPGGDEVVLRLARGAQVLLRGAWDRATAAFVRAADGGPEWEAGLTAWDGGVAVVRPVPPGRWTIRLVEGARSWTWTVTASAGGVVEPR